jgi:hypothetical protein
MLSARAAPENDGANGSLLIPEGATLLVRSYHDDGRIVGVTWDGQDLLMFAQDLREHGVAVPEEPFTHTAER